MIFPTLKVRRIHGNGEVNPIAKLGANLRLLSLGTEEYADPVKPHFTRARDYILGQVSVACIFDAARDFTFVANLYTSNFSAGVDGWVGNWAGTPSTLSAPETFEGVTEFLRILGGTTTTFNTGYKNPIAGMQDVGFRLRFLYGLDIQGTDLAELIAEDSSQQSIKQLGPYKQADGNLWVMDLVMAYSQASPSNLVIAGATVTNSQTYLQNNESIYIKDVIIDTVAGFHGFPIGGSAYPYWSVAIGHFIRFDGIGDVIINYGFGTDINANTVGTFYYRLDIVLGAEITYYSVFGDVSNYFEFGVDASNKGFIQSGAGGRVTTTESLSAADSVITVKCTTTALEFWENDTKLTLSASTPNWMDGETGLIDGVMGRNHSTVYSAQDFKGNFYVNRETDEQEDGIYRTWLLDQ